MSYEELTGFVEFSPLLQRETMVVTFYLLSGRQQTFRNWIFSMRKEFTPGAYTSTEQGDRNVFVGVASLVIVSIHLYIEILTELWTVWKISYSWEKKNLKMAVNSCFQNKAFSLSDLLITIFSPSHDMLKSRDMVKKRLRVVSRTFLFAPASFRSLSSSPGSFRPWLFAPGRFAHSDYFDNTCSIKSFHAYICIRRVFRGT